MTRWMKRKDSPHIIIYDDRLKNDNRFETLPEGFAVGAYQAEVFRTKGKPEQPIEYFFENSVEERVKEVLSEEVQSPISAFVVPESIGDVAPDIDKIELVSSDNTQKPVVKPIYRMNKDELVLYIANTFGVPVNCSGTRADLLKMAKELHEKREK